MLFRSIRSRLALSFAGIALVAAVALGAVLLVILQNFYLRQELDYLRGNAQSIGKVVVGMISADASHDEVQSQIENLAFLSQTRVRVFGAAGQLLYDSGSPQNLDVNLAARKQLVAVNEGNPPGDLLPILSIQQGSSVSGNVTVRAFPVPPGGSAAQDNSQSGSVSVSPGPASPDGSVPVQGPKGVFVFQSIKVSSSPYGFYLNGEAVPIGAPRSSLRITALLENPDSKAGIGTIQLSEGPAYGTAILKNVALGWLLASTIAVLLAAAIGWFISRRISAPLLALTHLTARVAQGDLSSRAGLTSRDEFGQLASSFNEMAERVETTVTTLRRFVSDAAHELRTPLTALHTNLDLLADEKDAATRLVFLARAREMINRLEELNTNLLDLSRLEANGHAGTRSTVDLARTLQLRSEIYASQAEQAGLAFELESAPSPAPVIVDAGQIERAMDNLVDNACKFTPPGGTMRVALSLEDGRVRFSVADTGIGIPADDLPQLFNRFHRGRNSTAYPGSGLGLAIVRAIAAAYAGQVEVRSDGEGKGSRFTLSLPAAFPPEG